ncbi:MAG: hypothetical protein H6721_33715 [Sandaracinus sp.]|nr:hypothetical protein [Sandaracinus sp.]MCB9637094.1 hypothetical protein [Sandaracinus sp.]
MSTRRRPVYAFVDGALLRVAHEAFLFDSYWWRWHAAPELVSRFVEGPLPAQGRPRNPALEMPESSILWGPAAVQLEASRIVAVEVGTWWPEISIEYQGPDVVERYVLGDGPWPGSVPSSAMQEEGDALSKVIAWARAHGVEIRDGGWLAAKVVEPEPTRFPERRSDASGGYRDSAYTTSIRTSPLEPHERLLRWTVLRLGREWPIPQEVALNHETVFVRGKDDVSYALPLASLRARRDLGVDAVYVFGRHTQLPMLGRRGGCPVRTVLDRQLRAKGG